MTPVLVAPAAGPSSLWPGAPRREVGVDALWGLLAAPGLGTWAGDAVSSCLEGAVASQDKTFKIREDGKGYSCPLSASLKQVIRTRQRPCGKVRLSGSLQIVGGMFPPLETPAQLCD